MINNLLFALTLVSALGCGLIAGAFFASSVFVMKALASLPPAQGIAAMQSINITVITPLFMLAFLGTAATCAVLAIKSLLRWSEPGAVYLLVGGVLYLVGMAVIHEQPSHVTEPEPSQGVILIFVLVAACMMADMI